MAIVFAATTIALVAAALLVATVIDPLPYARPGELVFIWGSKDRVSRPAVPVSTIEAIRAQARSITELEFFSRPGTVWVGREPSTAAIACFTSPRLLQMLGARLLVGRFPDRPDELVVSKRFLRGDDPSSVLGTPLVVGGSVFRIVGVLPTAFFFPDTDVSLFLTLVGPQARGFEPVIGIGRIDNSLGPSAAQEELDLLAGRLSSAWKVSVVLGIHPTADILVGPQRRGLWVIALVCLALVFLASATAAHAQADRAISRLPELAVRIAMGSSLESETRNLVATLAVCGAVGAGAGGLAAEAILSVIRRAQLRQVIGIDAAYVTWWSVCAIATLAIIVLVCSGAGALKALRAHGVAAFLRSGGFPVSPARRAIPTRLVMLTAQLSIGLTLVALTATLNAAFGTLSTSSWGFTAPGVLVGDIQLPDRLKTTAAQAEAIDTALTRLRTVPSIQQVASGHTAPFRLGSWRPTIVSIDGNLRSADVALYQVGPGYFAALGTAVIAGQEFSLRPPEPSQAVVGKRLANALWGRENPIGRRFRLMRPTKARLEAIMNRVWSGDNSVLAEPGNIEPAEQSDRVVVGVVDDVRMAGVEFEARAAVYIDERLPFAGDRFAIPDRRIVVRTQGDRTQVAEVLREFLVEDIDGVRVGQIVDLERLVRESIGSVGAGRLALYCLAVLGAVSVSFALFGAASAARRFLESREYKHAVQMALGASVGRIQREMLMSLSVAYALGLLLAVVATWYGMRYLQSLLPIDMAVQWPHAAFVTVFALVVLLLPISFAARRLRRFDPAVMLRSKGAS